MAPGVWPENDHKSLRDGFWNRFQAFCALKYLQSARRDQTDRFEAMLPIKTVRSYYCATIPKHHPCPSRDHETFSVVQDH